MASLVKQASGASVGSLPFLLCPGIMLQELKLDLSLLCLKNISSTSLKV